jgi:hypothetical protein
MATLPETATWEAGIYQLETTDPVQGGLNGIDNLQGKQLANRTVYLKQQVDAANTLLVNASPVATISALLNRATTVGAVNVLNYHSGLKGGGGVFYWDATGNATEHNGGTVISPLASFPTDWNNQTQLATWFDGSTLTGTGVWRRQYDSAVNARWFGAKGDGVSDDTKAIQQSLHLKTGVVYVPSGTYKLNAITVDVAINTLAGDGITTILDFSTTSDVNCISFVGSVAPPYSQNGNGLFGLYLKGNNKQTALNIDNTLSGAVSHIVLERLNISGFNVGIYYGNNAYLIRHRSLDIFNCTTCLYSDGTKTDYGENWYYDGCAFYNSTNIADITGGGHDLYFTGCSFDYSTYIFKKVNVASIFLNQCHIEYTHTAQDSLCTVSGNEGYLSIRDSFITSTSDGTESGRVGVCDNGHIAIVGCKIHNFAKSVTKDYLIELVNDGKGTLFRNSFLDTDNMAKGLFNNNIFEKSYAYITADTQAITKTKTGTNIILADGANSNEITVQKTYGGGSLAGFVLYFPLNGGTRFKIKVSLVESTSMYGDAYFTIGVAESIGFNDNGLPRLVKVTAQGAVTQTLPTVNFTNYVYTETATQTNFGYCDVNLVNVNGLGNTLKLKVEVYTI